MLLRVAPCTETAWKRRAAQAVRLEGWEKYQPLPFPVGCPTTAHQGGISAHISQVLRAIVLVVAPLPLGLRGLRAMLLLLCLPPRLLRQPQH